MTPDYENYFNARIQQLLTTEQANVSYPLDSDASKAHSAQVIASDALRAVLNVPLAGEKKLRADAQVLLLLAFQELVARPVKMAGNWTAKPSLEEAISADMRTIAEAASRRHDGPEVSAHDIVNATSDLWERLKCGGEHGDEMVWD